MPRRVELDPTPALLAGVLALGLVIQLALPQPSPLADIPVATARPPGAAGLAASGAGARLAAAPAYPAILERPLFSPSRSGAAAAAVAGDVAPPGALALLGVALDGARASATLTTIGGAPQSLRPGEVIAGWRLSAVERDHAILSRGGVAQMLKVGAPPQALAGAPLAAPAGVPVR